MTSPATEPLKLAYWVPNVSDGLILCGFLHYHEDVQYFGAKVLPIPRELEAAELESVA